MESALKSAKYKPKPVITKEEDLILSGAGFIEILRVVLGKGISCRFQAAGHSMSPFIKNGDVVTISPLRGSAPGIGKVVAFIHPVNGALTVHRLVGMKNGFFLMKGDSTSRVDGLVRKTNILGWVKKVERDGEDVYLGLGCERYLIALLTRIGIPYVWLRPLWKIIRPLFKKWLKG